MLFGRFYIKQIREYEENTQNSILEAISNMDICTICDLVALSNTTTIEMACEILDNYLVDKSMSDVITELRKSLFGDIDENKLDDTNSFNANTFKYLYEIYNQFCMILLGLGISYTEFYSMSTKEVYDVYNGIKSKQINEINKQLMLNHVLAGMIGSAVWGKLDKEVPKVGEEKQSEIVSTADFGEIDSKTLNNIMALKSIQNRNGVDNNGRH